MTDETFAGVLTLILVGIWWGGGILIGATGILAAIQRLWGRLEGSVQKTKEDVNGR